MTIKYDLYNGGSYELDVDYKEIGEVIAKTLLRQYKKLSKEETIKAIVHDYFTEMDDDEIMYQFEDVLKDEFADRLPEGVVINGFDIDDIDE